MELIQLGLIFVAAAAFRRAYTAALRSRFAPAARADAPAFVSRYISCVHAGALVGLGLLWEAGLARPGWWTLLARAVPIGYLAHDAHIIWAEPSLWEASALLHHAAFAVLVYVAAPPFPDHTARAFLAEISVPFLNLGWVLLKTKEVARWPRAFAANNVALLLSFSLFRVRTFTQFTVEAATDSNWAVLPPVATLAALNWYWFALLVKKAFALAR